MKNTEKLIVGYDAETEKTDKLIVGYDAEDQTHAAPEQTPPARATLRLQENAFEDKA